MYTVTRMENMAAHRYLFFSTPSFLPPPPNPCNLFEHYWRSIATFEGLRAKSLQWI